MMALHRGMAKAAGYARALARRAAANLPWFAIRRVLTALARFANTDGVVDCVPPAKVDAARAFSKKTIAIFVSDFFFWRARRLPLALRVCAAS